jgi:hypothetical protein
MAVSSTRLREESTEKSDLLVSVLISPLDHLAKDHLKDRLEAIIDPTRGKAPDVLANNVRALSQISGATCPII